jgi:hypothetical protein
MKKEKTHKNDSIIAEEMTMVGKTEEGLPEADKRRLSWKG